MTRANVNRWMAGWLLVGTLTLSLGLGACQRTSTAGPGTTGAPLARAEKDATPKDTAAPAQKRVFGPEEEQWSAVVDKALAYLKKARAADGSYSKERSLGITGVVVTGILQTGRVDPDDPFVANSLKFIESLINTKEGHIAGKDPRNQLKNYVTAVNVMAFAEADKALARAGKPPRYQKVVANAARFLKDLQWDEAEGIQPSNNMFGGFGYDSKNRPDLSNSQIALDALKAAGIPPTDPHLQKAVTFISRCQNLKSEHNDQPWAGKINDGGFIYTAAGDGESKAGSTPDGGLISYGSMTYAGIKSMIYAGVSKDDFRVKLALDWARKNYTFDENPGMPKERNQQGLYYYYHTMAKCFDTLGIDEFEDAKKVKHDWRRDLTEALAKRQRPDGSWVNEHDRWLEGDPNLVTGYALMALNYCKPTKR